MTFSMSVHAVLRLGATRRPFLAPEISLRFVLAARHLQGELSMKELLRIAKRYALEVVLHPKLGERGEVYYMMIITNIPRKEEVYKARHHDLILLAEGGIRRLKDYLVAFAIGPGGEINPNHVHPWASQQVIL